MNATSKRARVSASRRALCTLRTLAPPAALLLALGLTAGYWGTGCGDTGSQGAQGGATGATTTMPRPTTTTTTTGTGGSGGTVSDAGGCAPEPIPEGIPPDWEEYTDWSCKCRFYVPGSTAALPAPIAWEPCPASPSGIACQTMVVDWTTKRGAIGSGSDAFDRNPDGSAVLELTRLASKVYSMHLIADADGPARSAIMYPWGGRHFGQLSCAMYNAALKDGKAIRFVEATTAPQPTRPITKAPSAVQSTTFIRRCSSIRPTRQSLHRELEG